MTTTRKNHRVKRGSNTVTQWWRETYSYFYADKATFGKGKRAHVAPQIRER